MRAEGLKFKIMFGAGTLVGPGPAGGLGTALGQDRLTYLKMNRKRKT